MISAQMDKVDDGQSYFPNDPLQKSYIDELDDKRNKLNGIVHENIEVQKQLTDGYNALWNEYQKNKDELNQYKMSRKCAEHTTNELNKENQILTRQLGEWNAINRYLEAENVRVENALAEERSNAVRLQRENEAREKSVERISAELRNATKASHETECELRRRTGERDELRLAWEIANEKLSRMTNKHEIEKMRLAKEGDITSTELKLERHRNAGLNAIACELNDRLRCQADELRESNDENERLRQTLAAERARADGCSDELQKYASRAVNEKEESDRRLEECAERLRCAAAENELLSAEIDGLRRRLDAAVKDGDERHESLAGKMDEELKRLNAEVNSKSGIIAELEERLAVVKRTTQCMADTAAEEASNRKSTTNAQQKPDESSSCTSPFFQSYGKVLGELKSNGEYPYVENDSDDYYGIAAERLEKNDSFDKFISRCESIVRNYNKQML